MPASQKKMDITWNQIPVMTEDKAERIRLVMKELERYAMSETSRAQIAEEMVHSVAVRGCPCVHMAMHKDVSAGGHTKRFMVIFDHSSSIEDEEGGEGRGWKEYVLSATDGELLYSIEHPEPVPLVWKWKTIEFQPSL
jgi:hypothetical protein